jgi:hypothetical protein
VIANSLIVWIEGCIDTSWCSCSADQAAVIMLRDEDLAQNKKLNRMSGKAAYIFLSAVLSQLCRNVYTSIENRKNENCGRYVCYLNFYYSFCYKYSAVKNWEKYKECGPLESETNTK